jgi:hypothetical protein
MRRYQYAGTDKNQNVSGANWIFCRGPWRLSWRFRKADGDGLFAARYPAALAAFAGAERAALSSAHGTSTSYLLLYRTSGANWIFWLPCCPPFG